MNIEIGEKTCIRLSVFADKHNLSLSAAIDCLLDNRQGVGDSSPSPAVSQPGYSRLEIVYFPEGEENFKQKFLAIDSLRRIAYVRIHYFGGHVAYREWRAANIDEDSSIRGNLMGGHLRNWRRRNIVKAEVSLKPFLVNVSLPPFAD